MRFFILLICGLYVSGCASHVKFYDRFEVDEPVNHVSNLYLDPYGDLYKSSDASLPNAQGQPDTLRCAFDRELCRRTVRLPQDNLDVWRAEQDSRWDMSAQRVIDDLKASGGARPIVVLIHGFRVPDAQKDYGLARDEINAAMTDGITPYYVHVHWDGRNFNTVGVADAWWEAQWSGPQVGFRLRRFLNLIAEKYDRAAVTDATFEGGPAVRILTHSSGAFVGAAIVSDTGGSLPCMKDKKFRIGSDGVRRNKCGPTYLAYGENRDSRDISNLDSVPQIRDLRMGMLAPATAAVAFTGSTQEGWSGAGLLTGPESALIIAYNPKDEIITKFGLPTGLGGESGLAANPDMICSIVDRFQSPDGAYILPKQLF